ncbi:unnamed protein product, partial [Hymenolepis diminuta]
SLCIFQNYLLFAFSTIIPQFFRPRSWSDFIYVPMTHNPRLPYLNASIDSSHSITASLHIKRHICAQALAWPYLNDSYKANLVVQTTQTGQWGLLHVLFSSSLPQHAALSPSLSPSLRYSL